MENKPETKVDRSRLTLLLGLTSTAAAAGCVTSTAKKKNPYATFDRRNVDAFDDERSGGDSGGGGSH